MLYPAHYVAASAIAGVGLFTAEPINIADDVYKYDERFVRIITLDELKDLPPGLRKAVRNYAYPGAGKDRLKDALYYCTDDSRFMNHSDNPNLVWIPSRDIYIAARSIAKDEELTCNYHDFNEPHDPMLNMLK